MVYIRIDIRKTFPAYMFFIVQVTLGISMLYMTFGGDTSPMLIKRHNFSLI
jgi:hypothetical protein